MSSFFMIYDHLKQFVPLTEFFRLAAYIPYPSLPCPVLALSNGNYVSELGKINYDSYWFGALSYDYKNQIDKSLSSQNPDNIMFPEVCFFQPEVLVFFHSGHEAEIQIMDGSTEYEKIINRLVFSGKEEYREVFFELKFRESSSSYMEKIRKIQHHIQQGDFYELNYCTELFAENVTLSPFDFFCEFYQYSKNPFSAYFKVNDRHVICGSPERFLYKNGNKIISQPIKGTISRSADYEKDLQQIHRLKNSFKDRTENVMIVDLVRNDLSKIAQRNSVTVEELFGVYSFDTVHQMISTVSCQLKNRLSFKDIIHAAFPMGSMTGAPKKIVMETIERLEETKRGIYSGTIGYISPLGNFDFNVVIRSLVYNESRKYLSYHTGGAITFLSDAEQEYEECLLKAQAAQQFLKQRGVSA